MQLCARVASLIGWPQVTGSEARLRLRHSLGQSATVASLPEGCSFTLYTGRGFKVGNSLQSSYSCQFLVVYYLLPLSPRAPARGWLLMLRSHCTGSSLSGWGVMSDVRLMLGWHHRVKTVRLRCDVWCNADITETRLSGYCVMSDVILTSERQVCQAA